MSTFYAGNAKILAFARQVDKDTPAGAPTFAMRIRGFTENPVRVQGPLEETDRSAQQGASHVTAIAPSFALDAYLRYMEINTIAEMLLGGNTDSVTVSPTSHEAFPDQNGDYWTAWHIEPGLFTNRYDGVRCVQGTFQSQDDGQTEWLITGLTFEALGFTAGEAEPAGLDALLDDEEPAIWAETTVTYDAVHPGTTKLFSATINRQANRAQGDNGFRGLAVVNGKLMVSGTVTRYVENDDLMRLVHTGTSGGTAPTATIGTQALRVVIERAADRSIDMVFTEVAYPTREQAPNLDGQPLVEALGFENQPQDDIADNVIITTTNDATTV